MRVQELYEQVAQLGFEESLESNDRFIFAANRAIYQINSLRPHIAYVDIVHYPLANLLPNSSLEPLFCQGSKIYNVASGRAIYFEAMGSGKVLIDDENDSSILDKDFDSKGKFTSYSFIIPNTQNKPITVTFKSDYAYALRNVAIYESCLSNDAKDIPCYGAYIRYDLKNIADDFLAFSTPPIVEDRNYTRLVDGYEIESDTLLLPYGAPSVYRVSYKRKPKQIGESGVLPANDESVIDLDEELCTLLPLLTASYIWLEDEPERSMYYKNLYNERAAEIISFSRNLSPAKALNVNGW